MAKLRKPMHNPRGTVQIICGHIVEDFDHDGNKTGEHYKETDRFERSNNVHRINQR